MSLRSMHGNILCAVDVETTGTLAGYHEIIQIACVPLNHHLEPSEDHRFFYMNFQPEFPERMSEECARKHGLSLEDLKDAPTQEKGIMFLEEWYESLNLPFNKRLVPLAHNWGFERGFLINLLGLIGFDYMWQVHPRDTMILAGHINDLYAWHGLTPPFSKLSLPSLCTRFDIELNNAHDALADSIATAKLYGALLRFMG
jgi:DNA polymerase III epsilon subunit-like protein